MQFSLTCRALTDLRRALQAALLPSRQVTVTASHSLLMAHISFAMLQFRNEWSLASNDCKKGIRLLLKTN